MCVYSVYIYIYIYKHTHTHNTHDTHDTHTHTTHNTHTHTHTHEIKTSFSYTTGLDPALPGFEHRKREVRLDSTDAKFVDVLHTSFSYRVGMKERVGHADFYINGGGTQPGCGVY